MKRLLFAILSLFFIVVACSKSKPRGILSERKMTNLMTEIYVLDGYLNTLPIDSSRKLLPVLYGSLFDRFKIDSTMFMQNLDYYYGNPLELEKLNTKVQKKLSGYERDAVRVDSIEQARVMDSINTAHRWLRLAQEAKDLIQNVYLDTSTVYDFAENNRKFFGTVPLVIQRRELYKPISRVPMEIASDSTGIELVSDSLAIQDTVKLIPIIDTTSNLPRLFRYRIFEWNKIQHLGLQTDSVRRDSLTREEDVALKPIVGPTSNLPRLSRRQRNELNSVKQNL